MSWDCVNQDTQKLPIDFLRCVNGNTIEGDRAFCELCAARGQPASSADLLAAVIEGLILLR